MLPENKVRPRAIEMSFCRKMGVYTKIPRARAIAEGIKIVPTRWIDTNKGDDADPDYRSRLVAKEIQTKQRSDWFAATPPLEVLKTILSLAATGRDNKVLMVNDVKRAYFYPPVRRRICVELPAEENDHDDMVGLLQLSMYGTQDAAKNWQDTFSEHLIQIGFLQGKATPCAFFHPARRIWLMVHGDDYFSCGERSNVAWFRGQLEAQFDMKTTVVGDEFGEAKRVKILNRVVALTSDGYTYEADPKHVPKIIADIGLVSGAGDGTKGSIPADPPLDPRLYRSICARANFLSLDRPDIQFSVKECCRAMSNPTCQSWDSLKRVGRHLAKSLRLVQMFEFQDNADVVDVFTDSDFAGDTVSRKSTSGGALLLGKHCVRTWSKTQDTIALSSGEAELMALVKASCEGLGMRSILSDFAVAAVVHVHMDASAALGMTRRLGLGKVRHIDTSLLWMQQKAAQELVKFSKVPGKANPADMLTKILDKVTVSGYLDMLGFEFSSVIALKAFRPH